MIAKHCFAGYATGVAIAKFTLWASAQRAFPMPETVMDRFAVSRATAHRWLNFYEEAACVTRPRRDKWGRVRSAA